MKRWLIVVAFVVLTGAVLYYSERRKSEGRVGPEAALNVLAETQREISRVPARVTRLSDEEEISLGDALASRYLQQPGWSDEGNRAIEKYMVSVGRRVTIHTRRRLDYRVHFIPDKNLVNAFALPGGHIFISEGLFKLMKTEDQLAAVLGHEAEHIDHYHCNEKMALRNSALSVLIGLPVELFQAGYSKEQELEADRDGTALAVMAGYSPQGAIHMFQVFENLEQQYVLKASAPDQEFSQVAIQSLEGYFQSHPSSQERERQIRAFIASKNWPASEERPLGIAAAKVATPTLNGDAGQ
ncbi:MAG TPA: M48 family metallopeptidase [Candidatus Angelobacter sp.]|nr:M48 family metallopeptidase [Candidatus Angelobacter sp.]